MLALFEQLCEPLALTWQERSTVALGFWLFSHGVGPNSWLSITRGSFRRHEPPRLSRRLVGLSHADMADSGICE